jgi:type I restriction-modification system DNA methylase subunit
MNPPFSLKRDKEYDFVDHALKQMVKGGLLFSILPYSVIAKSGQARTWRGNLLKRHTLLSIVTFPIDIFYPVSAPPVGVFIKQGVSHDYDKNVLWVRAETDGHLKSKGKRLPSPLTTNRLEDCLHTVRAFLDNPDIVVQSEPRFIIAAPINADDALLELVPEAYLEQGALEPEAMLAGVESILRDASAFLVRNRVRASWDGTG